MKVIIADKGYQANDESERASARIQFFKELRFMAFFLYAILGFIQ